MATLEAAVLGGKNYFLIGRLAPSELCPQGVLVSRHHCMLYEHNGSYFIISFSRNGTYINASSKAFKAKHEVPRLTNDSRFVSLFRFYLTEAREFDAVDRLRAAEVELAAENPKESLIYRLIELMKKKDFLERLSELSVKLEDRTYIGIPLHKLKKEKTESIQLEESIFEEEKGEEEVLAEFYTMTFRR